MPPSRASFVRGRAVAVAVLVASVSAVALARPRLVTQERAAKDDSDLYTLPPPDAMPAVSLGYRAALADLLFTSTIITYGIHAEERRRFDAVADYLDAIVELDPTFREPYRFADMLIIYQAVGNPTPEHVRRARRILDRGLEMRPNDGPLWLSAGQFMAFIAPQWLTDEKEKVEYRAIGAKELARAGELADDRNVNVGWQALAAAGVFTKEGETQAAISYLERAYAVTDDAELREAIAKRLAALQHDAELSRAQRLYEAFRASWQADLPSASPTRLLVLGPPWDVAACAGRMDSDAVRCAKSWNDWAAAQQR